MRKGGRRYEDVISMVGWSGNGGERTEEHA